MYDAVVTAGGRLGESAAARYGSDVKALVRIGGVTLLEKIVSALRGSAQVRRICVVGPRAASGVATDIDEWIDEFETGEENVIAALAAGTTPRVIYSASDLPFVTAADVIDFVSRVPPDADAAYPIFEREEFLRAFPGGRSTFARLADGEWTGGSVLVLTPGKILTRKDLLARGFRARKQLLALAATFGPLLAVKYAAGMARVDELAARGGRMIGGRVVAVRGASPTLAMDCDGERDIEYARSRS